MLKTKYINLSEAKNSDYLIALLGYFLIALFVLSGVIFLPGTFGFFHDWFIGPYPEMNQFWADSGFYIWSSQTGNKIHPTDWIFRIALYPFSFLGGEVLSKGLAVLIITLSGFSAFCLGRQFKLSPISSFAAGILYIFSPVVFTRVVAGYIYYLVAYLLAPLILANFLKGREESRNRYFIIAGVLLAFAFIQLQFILLIFIILLVFSLVDFRNIKKSTQGLLIIFSIGFLIDLSPVVFSQLFIPISDSPFDIERLLSFPEIPSTSDLLKSFRLLGYDLHPYGYENLSDAGIIPTWILYLDFVLPIMGFSALIFLRKNKFVLSFAIVSMIGLFLLKGLNPPFPEIFSFLFTYGFYIFREVWHVAFLYGLSMTFLIAFLLEKIKSYNFNFNFIKFPVILFLIAIVVLSNGYPILMGNFGGYLQTYSLPTDYDAIYSNSYSDTTYNTLVLPFIRPIKYDDLKLAGVDPIVNYWSNHIFPTDFNSAYPTSRFSAWLLSVMQENKTDNLGRLLSGFGIKYIILRHDFVSEYAEYIPLGSYPQFREAWYTSLEPFLDAQKDLVVVSDTARYKIYENINKAEKIFSPKLSAAGLTDFNSLLSISNISLLSNVAVYPSSYDNESLIFADNIQETKIPFDEFVELGTHTSSFDANKGWTDNVNWFGYDYLLASRLPQGAFTSSGSSVLSYELPSKYENKQIEIWLKALYWNKGGEIKIDINGEESIHSSLFSTNQSFQILKIFEGKSSNPLRISIENTIGENYLEGIYIKEDTESETQRQLNSTDRNFVVGIQNQRDSNLVRNPEFVFIDNQSGIISHSSPSYWNSSESCGSIFECSVNFTSGWRDNKSLQVSTEETAKDTYSWITGGEIDVNQNERYELVTHMKLNDAARNSHIGLEAYDATLKNWKQIEQCPSGIDGPLEWRQFSCEVIIPKSITKVRPILNAGWATQENEQAVTLFDAIYMFKSVDESSNLQNLDLIKEVIPQKQNNQLKLIKDYTRLNPTQWNVRTNSSEPFTVGFAEPYDSAWEAQIYKNGKKMDAARSIPLYGALNAFQIRETGNLEIVIKYMRQDWFEIGLIISAATFAFCIFWLLYDWRRNRLKSSTPF
jgi:hypothetical protein